MKDKAKKKVLSISRKLLLSNNVGDVLRDVQHLLHSWFVFCEEKSAEINGVYLNFKRKQFFPPQFYIFSQACIDLLWHSIKVEQGII